MTPWEQLRQWDEARPSVPAEHGLTAAAGLYLLLQQPRHPVAGLAALVGGLALLLRAATGRDGLLAWLARQAPASDETAFHAVAAPWPYDEQVMLSDPERVDRPAAAAS